jgi:uncharacterized membrane protein
MEIILFIIDNIASIVNIILALVIILLMKSNDCLKLKVDRLEYAVDYLLKKQEENDK